MTTENNNAFDDYMSYDGSSSESSQEFNVCTKKQCSKDPPSEPSEVDLEDEDEGDLTETDDDYEDLDQTMHPNRTFHVDSVIALSINDYGFYCGNEAQKYLDYSFFDMYTCILMFRHLRLAIIAPCGFFDCDRVPEYEYDFKHVAAQVFIARTDETPDFLRTCLAFQNDKRIINNILSYYVR